MPNHLRIGYLLLLMTIIIGIVSCGNNDVKSPKASLLDASSNDTSKNTLVEWIDSLVDVGTIKPGDKSEIKFRFKNIGKNPLLIISARPGCGCTVADYPKEAITVGKEGTITAIFDSHDKAEGTFYKNILVTSNSKPELQYLYFKGTISTKTESEIKKDSINNSLHKSKKVLSKDLILIPNKK